MNISEVLQLKTVQPVCEKVYRNRRDELISSMTLEINKLRENTTFKPITKRLLALRVNKNPFLSKDDDELELVFKECLKCGSFAKLFWMCK